MSQDHYFDVVTNVIGLVAAVLGDKFYWWIDPVGAIVLALYTIINWCETRSKKGGKKKSQTAQSVRFSGLKKCGKLKQENSCHF